MNFVQQTKNAMNEAIYIRMGVCETLMPDVVAPEHIRTIAAMYVSSADLLSIHYATI